MQINWDNFKVNNLDSEGLRLKFEHLCRQLFIKENISGNKQFKYLHANPNNPGLETEPIYDEENKRNIGFQAKFFYPRVNYSQIEHSAKMTVKHYAGKVDLVFLFCNQPLTTDSLTRTVNILKAANIELQLITDKAILDLVELRYPYLAISYFGSHTIDMTWIRTHSTHMFDELGERYNCLFNVDTKSSIELSLFVHDQRAADYINGKKSKLVQEIERIRRNTERHRAYLSGLEQTVKNLSDVDVETLYASINWKETLEEAAVSYLEEYKATLIKLGTKRRDLREDIHGLNVSKEEHGETQIKKDSHH